MPLIIGVDEAGYGPNLGPLVIAASAWRVASEQMPAAPESQRALMEFLLCERFGLGKAQRVGADAAAGPWIADSKIVYRSGGLAALERTVLAALIVAIDKVGSDLLNEPDDMGGKMRESAGGGTSALPPLPRTAAELCRAVAGRYAAGWIEDRANRAIDLTLPRAATLAEIDRAAAAWRAKADRAPLELLGLAARPIFPAEFNRLLDQRQRKSDLLSQASLELAFRVIERVRDFGGATESLTVYCDKHGGRNRYSAQLSEASGGAFFSPIEESRDASVYRGRCDGRAMEWLFLSRAERLVPVALASMTAKYLRELAMEAFNRYWIGRVGRLRATAGYPVDARRFLAETEAARRAEAMPLSDFWRNK